MNINMNKEGDKLTVALEGRLDTLTSPDLEEKITPELESLTELVFDFRDLEYISSAGLRVLLMAAQTMEDKGRMVVRNVSSDIMDIFEVTGFIDILTIE